MWVLEVRDDTGHLMPASSLSPILAPPSWHLGCTDKRVWRGQECLQPGKAEWGLRDLRRRSGAHRLPHGRRQLWRPTLPFGLWLRLAQLPHRLYLQPTDASTLVRNTHRARQWAVKEKLHPSRDPAAIGGKATPPSRGNRWARNKRAICIFRTPKHSIKLLP